MIYYIDNGDCFLSTSYHSGSVSGILFAMVTLIIYFIPVIVAVIRKHNNLVAIIILNTFLGWTFFGWVLALIWSVIKK